MTIAKHWLLLPLLTVSLASQAGSNTDDQVIVNRKSTIRLVMNRITKEHYAPKPVDDNFSRAVWQKYLLALDGNKKVFLEADIQRLRHYETLIDDQLNNPSLEYFDAIYDLSMQRLNEVMHTYRALLARPMDFRKTETVQPERTAADFPADEAARTEVWRKALKYAVLKKMLEIQKANPKKSDATAEQEARQSVLQSTDGQFKTLMSSTAKDDRFNAYMNTVAMEMDPHTMYYGPADANARDAMMAHRYYGLGLELTSREGDIVIKRILPGGTAAASGLLQADDHILQLSDAQGQMIDIGGMNIVEISKMIRGEKGTSIKLLVRTTTGSEKEVTVPRGEIREEENAARSAVIEKGNKKIGYLFLQEFYRDFKKPDGAQCAVDMAREVEKLNAEKVDGIVVDLRGNPGGSLDEVVRIAGIFIKTGPVVLGKGKDKTDTYPINNGDQTMYDGPLAVMIDESSASASEIFAAAVQDYRRGIIVGSPSSFGKGTMQATLPMGKLGDPAKGIPNISYGSLTLTISKFYRINGTTTQLNGVTPDVILPNRKSTMKIREKDFNNALRADTINSAYYITSPLAARLPQIIQSAGTRINADSTFRLISKEIGWLKENEAPVFSLQKEKFRQQQAAIQVHEVNLDKALHLPAARTLQMRATGGNATEAAKAARFQEWISTRRTDIYLDATTDIVLDMIGK
ncbi:carboxy terminal-processing peptidase [Chitinophaga sp. Mgbs1]|uniref:Carboxy terminal-processing peptidase n=1 Tax=Chitinophaga solisilvae TaxID=1233460 RepID=A0A3S1CY43_9BACT|nr:carboxy terminal-processing peptidase [Chitinophaga solisilvae]